MLDYDWKGSTITAGQNTRGKKEVKQLANSKVNKVETKVQPTEENQNLLAALTYLLFFVTGIIFLVIEKKNDYIRFHAVQSIAVFGPLFVVLIILSTFFGPLGWILNFLVSILVFVLWIILMYKAFNGERYKIPYIGAWAEKQLKNI